ncbi:MAG: sulfatase [Candidatus Omnitrophica bacterium]|nr:sulfatase [Candidatus Omnitrophota bacterium]
MIRARLLLLVSLSVILFSWAEGQAIAQPNVLFIAIDDLNDWVGCLGGHPQVKTPNIDALAQRGMLFTNAHCASTACNPSRAAIFSGRYAKNTGVWSNSSARLPQHRPDLVLVPQAFKESGYLTLGTGKLLHGGAKSNRPLFEENFYPEQRWSPLEAEQAEYTEEELPTKGTEHPRHVVEIPGKKPVVLPLNGMPSDRAPDNPKGESFDWGPWEVSDSEMGDAQITDWAIEHIEKGFEKPFFMGVGYYRPHIPLWAPEEYFEAYPIYTIQLPPIFENDLADLSPIGKRFALEAYTGGLHSTVQRFGEWRNAVAAYLACITFVDRHVGRLIDALDNSPYAHNTWIVLWSDHGWHLGEKQHWGKWTGWERSTRVPLIIVPPKAISGEFAEPGSKCNQPVSLVDLYPTLAEVCDLSAIPDLDGQSLIPLLREPDLKTNRAVITTFGEGNTALRTDRWRYIRYEDGSEELYDHAQDPNEWNNLAGNPSTNATLTELREIALAE